MDRIIIGAPYNHSVNLSVIMVKQWLTSMMALVGFAESVHYCIAVNRRYPRSVAAGVDCGHKVMISCTYF